MVKIAVIFLNGIRLEMSSEKEAELKIISFRG
jgi:hypothetical protein